MGIQHPPCTVFETLISPFLAPLLIHHHHIHRDTVLTSIHYIQRSLMDMGIKYIYMSSHNPCICQNWRSSGTRCNTTRVFSSHQVRCTSIRSCAVTRKQRVVCRGHHQCRICPASYVIKHGCIPSESIWNYYYCCSCWIRLYWVDRDQWASE